MLMIRENGTVYMASPMKYQNYYSGLRLDYRFEENGDIWHLNDGQGTIVMVAAKNARMVDLLRYSTVFDCEFSLEGMHQVVENIKYLIKGSNCFVVDDKIGVKLIIARGEKGFSISTFGAVFDVCEIEALDEDEACMLAVYENYKHIEDIEQRITMVYRKIEQMSLCQLFPIALIHTRDNSYTLLERG